MQMATLRWLDEYSNQGIVTTDTSLRIQTWNHWLQKHTGRRAEDAVGQPLFDVFPEIVERGFERYYRGALDGAIGVLAQPFHRYLIEIPVKMDMNTVAPMPQSCRIAPLIAEGQIVGTITVIDDVSDRVRSEAEMRRQITVAETALSTAEDALRQKDEFLATLSHEIRTPLNAVIGWTRILLSRTVDPAMLENGLRVIDRNATAQSRLIEDMLDMARIVSGKLRLELAPVDLVAMTRAAIEVLTPAAAAKGVAIRASLASTPRAIIADGDRVQQIAWNLLSNAVKFTPAGGSIQVEIPDEPGPLRLTVRDNGQGISKEFLPHVFERFRQANSSTSRSEGGLGLGLALVRQLVELHGGRITAESTGLGEGSEFTVTFPQPKQDAAATTWAPPRTVGRVLQGVRVLVIDDDVDWRQLLVMALGDYGAETFDVGSVRDALAWLESPEHVRPHIILADIGLPEHDGYSFIKALKSMDGVAEIPVIAVTAYAGADNERRAIEAGFRRQCTKPLAPDVLARAIVDVLAGTR
jgi:signal transduction histidine kinase/ActR/RegA family two-component response regulator